MNKKIFNQSLSNKKPFLYERKQIFQKSSKKEDFNSPSGTSKKQKRFIKTSIKKLNFIKKSQNMGVKNHHNSIDNKLIKKKNESLPKYTFTCKKGFSIDKNDKLSRNDDNNLLTSSNW